MSIVHECSAENCRTLTMGQFCVEHEKSKVVGHITSDAARRKRLCRLSVTVAAERHHAANAHTGQ
jgi:hypothetical protein